MAETPRARRVLMVVGVALLVSLAGCSGLAGTAADNADDEDDEEELETEATTEPPSEATTEQTEQQVTSRLQVISAVGAVDQESNTIESVSITVQRAPGADDIDLRETTVTWLGQNGEYRLVSESIDASAADGQFGHSAYKDPDDSAPVINDAADRAELTFDLGERDVEGQSSFGAALEEDDSVTVQLTTSYGGTTTEQLVVPQTLGAERVAL